MGLCLAGCDPPVTGACPNGCTATTQVNVKGVGRPCLTADDCRGLEAGECPRQFAAGGVNFCTVHCLNDSYCGGDAHCRRTHDGLQYCVPGNCADCFDILVSPGKPKTCDSGSINALGLGKPCNSQADCSGTKMPICPRQFHPLAPDWCNKFCKSDGECGPDGRCVLECSVEGGTVQFCIPNACYDKNYGGPDEPKPPDC